MFNGKGIKGDHLRDPEVPANVSRSIIDDENDG